jgi:hypothetical protein
MVTDLKFNATLLCRQHDSGGEWTFTAGNVYNGAK